MLAFIKGRIVDVGYEKVIVENQGIGYNILVPTNLLGNMRIGEEIQLFTYMNVREDGISLYGFLKRNQLELYKLLLMVNGVGPKAAMNILSKMSVDELQSAIVSEDAKAIAKTPGIGAKTAARIILDLKDKVTIEDVLSTAMDKTIAFNQAENDSFGQLRNDALEALVALGYSPSESMRAVKSVEISEEDNSQSVLKKALKRML